MMIRPIKMADYEATKLHINKQFTERISLFETQCGKVGFIVDFADAEGRKPSYLAEYYF
jgi:hypothetical protein